MTDLDLQQAFMNAVRDDRVDEARALIEAGAYVNAAEGEYANTALMKAAQFGHEQMAAMLLRQGAAPDAVDAHGDTALHWAIMTGKPRIAELLIRQGARVHVPDDEHDTPFDLAVQRKQQHIIDIIREMPGPKEELEALRIRAEAEAAALREAEEAHLKALSDRRERLRASAPRLKPRGSVP